MDKVQLQMSRAKNMRTEEMRWSKGKKREVTASYRQVIFCT